MVTFNLSYTAPINSPDSDIVLTQSQVWKCIQRKVRHAEDFVSAITHTSILSETPTSSTNDSVQQLKRRVTFAPGAHPSGASEAIETCTFFDPCRVDFQAADGSVITNVVSVGPSGQPDDLFYTYIFEWRHPEIEVGSDEAGAQEARDWKITKIAVQSTIETMRRLVRDENF